MSESKRAALYIRVSTEEQARHGLSLDEQKKALTDYAAKNHYDIIGIYADEGATARKAISRRKELQRLLHDVQADLVDVILFIKLDRWFRNVKDFYAAQTILDKHHVEWNAILEDYNTQTSAGRLNLNIRLSIAQNESDQTGDRIRFVFEGKKKRHEAISGKVPFGYSVIDKHFTPNADAPIVLDVFNFYALHGSVHRTRDYAIEKHDIHFRVAALRKLLANEKYIGTFYGIPNYAPPIVPRELFDRVQAIFKTHGRGDSPNKRIYIFRGLLRCPICGRRMLGRPGRYMRRGKIRAYPFYICQNRQHDKYCSFTGSIHESTLEKYLLSHLADALHEYGIALDTKRRKSGEEERQKHIKAARGKLDRLKDLYVNGFISRDDFKADFEKYNNQLTALLKTPTPRVQGMRQELKDLANMDDLEEVYASLSQEGKRDFWHSILSRIDITHFERGKGGRKEFSMTFLD